MKDEALKLALEGAANYIDALGGDSRKYRQALAAPVQEPVAWMFEDDEDNGHKTFIQTPPSPEVVAYLAKWNRPAWVPLYTTPPAAPDLQAELEATNRQVEILSDALAESRREVAALKAVQEPVAWISHNAGLYHFKPDESLDPLPLYLAPPAAQRQWVGLTDEEIDEIFNNWPTYNLDHFEFGKVVEAKVFEKNGAIAVVIPDALNPKDENPAYAAGWNDCRAEMLKGMKP
jgi:hypothetical protein